MGDYDLYHADRRKHKYIKKIGKRYFYTQDQIRAYLNEKKGDVTFEKGEEPDYALRDGSKMKDYHLDFNKSDAGSDKIGVRVGNKKVEFYNTTNKKYWNDDERWTVKRRGRLRSEYAEDGSRHTLDFSDKKTFNERKQKEQAREKKLSDSQIADGYRVSDEDFKKQQREARARELNKTRKSIEKHVNKSARSLSKQSAKGKQKIGAYLNKTSADIRNRPRARKRNIQGGTATVKRRNNG